MPGPNGKSKPLDSYTGAAAPAPTTITGYLVTPPKQINASDAKVGPRKGAAGQINADCFCE